jgi:anti-anti-sigma factor
MAQSNDAERADSSLLDLRRIEASFGCLAAERFHVETHVVRDTLHVGLLGEADIAAVEAIDERLLAFRGGGVRHLVVDLRRLTSIDSSALRLILVWDAECFRDGISFTIMPGPPAVQRVFEISGVLDRLTFSTA